MAPDPLRDHRHATGEVALTADVVIVGSGPGGAAVARTLAEGGARVVVLEEGPARPNFRPNYTHASRYHMQEGGAMVAMSADGMMPIAAGRGVGGGSLINSAICFRTPPHVLNAWSSLLDDDRYAPSALAPIFDEIEALIGVGETTDAVAGENNRIIVRGARALGLPGGLVRRNTPGCNGCGLCNVGCPIGGKGSVDRNLLPMATRAGAVIQADVKVHEVLVERGRAAGVAGVAHHPDTRQPVGRITVRAERVVIAAGGIGTPRLLHHAGLAARLGPEVGRHLHVHPGNAVLGLCDHPVKMWSGATQGAYFEHPDHPGLLPHTLTLPPGALMMVIGRVGHEAKSMLGELAHACGCVVMISDKGEGEVGATRSGRASIRYRFDPRDVDRIKVGMVQTARVLLAGGAKRVFGPVHGLGVHDDLASFEAALASRTIHDFSLYASHPMGSCRMGLSIHDSVIGADGEAHGLPGLTIADSSVFPSSLGVNPQLTTMVVATQIARGLLA